MNNSRHPVYVSILCASVLLLPIACGGDGDGGGSGSTVPGSHLTVVMDGQATSTGTTISGMSSGDSISVEVRNQGTAAFRLQPSLLSASNDLHVRDFILDFESDYVAPSGPSSESDTHPIPLDFVNQDPVYGIVFTLDLERIQEWADLPQDTIVARGFALPEALPVDLLLRRLPSPWTEDALLLVDGIPQPELLKQSISTTSMWGGKIAGQADSQVFLSFSPFGCQGWISTEDAIYHLMTEPSAEQGWQAPQVRLMREQDVVQSGYATRGRQLCTPQIVPEADADAGAGAHAGNGNNDLLGTTSTNTLSARCRVALETDYDYLGVKFSGDQSAATTYATQLIAAVGHQFQSQVQTRMTLSYLALYSTSEDPWESPDTGGDALQLLEEFRLAWKGNWPETADAAHLLASGLNSGGVSYLDALADQNWAFSVSTFIQGNLNWSDFPFNSSPFNWDFIVVAHELGHLFNANHTHDYCPPFDECAPQPFGTCQTQTDCSQKGTILSYCHTCIGGTNKINPTFEPYISNEMRGAAGANLSSWQIEPGETMRFTVTYEPKDGGNASVDLSWIHDAENVASPFSVELSGSD